MAEEKTSFVLYTDIIHTFEHLSVEQRGQVIWWILEYVNDRDPEPLPGLLQAVVEPIRQQLKRDLVKWEGRKGQKSSAGKKSAAIKKFKKYQQVVEAQIKAGWTETHLRNELETIKQNMRSIKDQTSVDFQYLAACGNFVNELLTESTPVESVEGAPTESTVNVNVNANVNVDDNVIVITKRTQIQKHLINAFTWHDSVCRNLKHSGFEIMPDDLKETWIPRFCDEIEATEEVFNDLTKTKRHFSYWIKKQLKNEAKNATGTKSTRFESTADHNAKLSAELKS